MFQPHCGIFQQTIYLPLRNARLEIDLDLADMLDLIVSDFVAESDADDAKLKANNTTNAWKMSMVKVGLGTLDNALDISYTSRSYGGQDV